MKIIRKILNLLSKFKETMFAYIQTKYIRLIWRAQGISLGPGNYFYGMPHLKVSDKASVIFGNNNIFRSKSTSNLIGINRPCILSVHNSAKIIIGNNCGFSGTVIGCFLEIKIGNNVRCGANTLITDSDWHTNDDRLGKPRPIDIGDNVWLGVNVIVLKGVEIGKNSIIGAGSVVIKNIPSDVIAAGNPCKVIRDI